MNIAGIFDYPGWLAIDQAMQFLLSAEGMKIGATFYNQDALFEAVHCSLLTPPNYTVEIMRPHLCNYMEIFRDELEVLPFFCLCAVNLFFKS